MRSTGSIFILFLFPLFLLAQPKEVIDALHGIQPGLLKREFNYQKCIAVDKSSTGGLTGSC